MKYRITTLLATSAATALLGCGAAWADAPAAPTPSPAPNPPMSATLAANPYPATFDAGPIGKLIVTGALTGGGFYQSNPQLDFNGNAKDGYGDITNALVMVNKADGPVQFFVAAGAYSLSYLGAGYTPSLDQTKQSFGYLPEGFLKIVPNSTWSIEAGQLPTLVGDEYTYSFQNLNIQRGMLWAQENVFTKGVQVNYSGGPLAVSVSWNDGFDSDVFNTISGLATYTFKNSDTLAFAASAATGTVHTSHSGFQTPEPYANSQIYNLIYAHTQGPWMISPYIQYTYVPKNDATGNLSAQTFGAAILGKYSFTPEFSVAGRFEYINTSGDMNLVWLGAPSRSDDFSITVTPTYQKGIFFVRGELSYTNFSVQAFGPAGNKRTRFAWRVKPA